MFYIMLLNISIHYLIALNELHRINNLHKFKYFIYILTILIITFSYRMKENAKCFAHKNYFGSLTSLQRVCFTV